jgi:CspA family cold shock protein
MSDITDSISTRFTGIVKWFNDKEGYGFITICDEGQHKNKDIFVHYKSIRVTNSQYVYLIQGEYVDFTLLKVLSDNHQYQASDISGIKNGPLMCESKNSARQISHKEKFKTDILDNGFTRVECKRTKNR